MLNSIEEREIVRLALQAEIMAFPSFPRAEVAEPFVQVARNGLTKVVVRSKLRTVLAGERAVVTVT